MTSLAAWTSATTAVHHMGPSSRVYDVAGLLTGAGPRGAAGAEEEEEDEEPVLCPVVTPLLPQRQCALHLRSPQPAHSLFNHIAPLPSRARVHFSVLRQTPKHRKPLLPIL